MTATQQQRINEAHPWIGGDSESNSTPPQDPLFSEFKESENMKGKVQTSAQGEMK